jgi:flagellar hook-basal body complex protein FliE
MSVEAISAVGAQLATQAPAAMTPAAIAMPAIPDPTSMTPAAGVFDQLVGSLAQIDSGVAANGQAATELALGQSDNLHQVLIGAERTRLQFELAMSMRNRVLEAYQEIMRMQV